MPYKTILVYIEDSKHLDKRIEVAARIALHENAFLIGLAVTGVSPALREQTVRNQDGVDIGLCSADYLESLRQRALKSLEKFENLVRRIGVVSYEKLLIDDEAANAVSERGLSADLIILGQSDPENPSLAAKIDFPEYVVLNSECPVLLVPYHGRIASIGDRVLVAWNRSNAASRAIRNAIPFLQQAKHVRLAIIAPEGNNPIEDGDPEREITSYLAQHNIAVDVVRKSGGSNAGDAILELAKEFESDLIVMGCVAHPRWREVMLGGATRRILESTSTPVLMSHSK